MDAQSIAELSVQAGYEGVENVVYKHIGVVAKEVLMSGGEALPPCAPSVQRPQGSQTRSDTKSVWQPTLVALCIFPTLGSVLAVLIRRAKLIFLEAGTESLNAAWCGKNVAQHHNYKVKFSLDFNRGS